MLCNACGLANLMIKTATCSLQVTINDHNDNDDHDDDTNDDLTTFIVTITSTIISFYFAIQSMLIASQIL